jgi:hypothetical protein
MQEQAAYAGPLPALLIATLLCMQPLHETTRHAAALHQFICSPTSFRGIGLPIGRPSLTVLCRPRLVVVWVHSNWSLCRDDTCELRGDASRRWATDTTTYGT